MTGISTSSDSCSESDDDLVMNQTLTKKKKLVKKNSKIVNTVDDSSGDDEGLPDVLTDGRGRVFQVVDGKLELLPTFFKDPVSGKLLRATPSSRKQSSTESSDDRTARKKEKKSRQRTKKQAEASVAATKLHGISPLRNRAHPVPPVPSLQDNRGKISDANEKWSVVDWAKMCPVKYAPTCTSKNLNLPLFVWAKLAELRALSAGPIMTTLSPGELDARLRHLQCVIELVGTNSAIAEYAGYGWQLGKDYDSKVQATMDSGASDWVTFNFMFSLGPHPSFFFICKG